MIGTTIAQRYYIIDKLVAGGFGETFLIEDNHMPTKRNRVLKRLIPVIDNPVMYEEVKRRFEHEAKILEKLGENTDHIPTLYAYFTDASSFYLVQEWIDGETLTESIARQGLWSSDQVSRLLKKLLPTLDLIHQKKIIHRDIKPDNIILRRGDQSPVLIDFGAVKEKIQGTSPHPSVQTLAIGTPGFMPPEQLTGRPVFSSDLYSLGLTAIYLLTGKTPHELNSDPQTGKILWQTPDVAVTPVLAQVLDQAIAPNSVYRFSDAQAMLTALGQSTIVQPQVQPPTPIPPVAQPVTQAPLPTPNEVPTPTPTFIAVPQTLQPQGMTNFQKTLVAAVVVGVGLFGIGMTFLGAAVLNAQRIQSSQSSLAGTGSPQSGTPTTPTINVVESGSSSQSQTTPTPVVPSQPSAPEPAPTPKPTPTPEPQTSITEAQAKKVVEYWLACKKELFAYPYNRNCGNKILTGKAYHDNIRRTDGKDSSVEWLENTGAYYRFQNQQVNTIRALNIVDTNRANVDVVVTEQRTLYSAKGSVDSKASGYDQRLVRYNLELTDGGWKIISYNTIEVL